MLVSDPDVDEVLVNGDEVWVDRRWRLERGGRADGHDRRAGDRADPRSDRSTRRSNDADRRRPPRRRGSGLRGRAAGRGRRFDRCRSVGSRPTCDHSPTSPTRPVSALLDQIVAGRCNVVVCGATSSGKTSLLASMVDSITDRRAPDRARRHHRAAVPSTPRGAPRGTTRPPPTGWPRSRSAISSAPRSRLRPDRLVVGEVRSATSASRWCRR